MFSEKIDRVALSHSFDEKLFRLLVASISDYAIFMIDPNGYIMSWNQGAENINGYTEDEIIGEHISIFYTNNDNKANAPRQNLNTALKDGTYETEGWKQRKDSSLYWANITFTTIYNDNGHLVGFAQITRDITARKEKEEEREEINVELEKQVKENNDTITSNEIRFRKLIENSYDGISLLDADLHVVYRSNSAERIIGWNNEERAGHEIEDLLHPQDRHIIKEVFAEVFTNPGKPVLCTYRSRHKLGHYVWIESLFTNR
ncbi:MAG: PAS domain S-box protein, partial [Bacteroidota bacterium]